MPIDPVQSIRVATTLVERFGVLAKPGTMTVSELELVIGEAQQLYPEIWRHLDEARGALAEQGRDVSTYDHLRGDEQAILGVTDIESTQGFNMISGSQYQSKTASINVAGYRRAQEACRLLMSAMPEIDWKALAREEEREIRAAGSLHAGKWKGTAKWIVIGAMLAGIAIIVYRTMTSIGDEPPRSTRPVPKDLTEAERRHLADRAEAISQAYQRYHASCSSSDRFVLGRLLRENGKTDEADTLDIKPCVPEHPSCDAMKDAIGARIAAGFDLTKDKTWGLNCQGILMSRGQGLEPGLAVVVTAKDRNGHTVSMRGVAIDSARDAVTFASAPGRLAGIGDLDGDGAEELVFVTPEALTISRIKGPGFTDDSGPIMPKGCSADVTVEGDFREGRDGKQKRVVLTVPEDGKGKGCPTPGRHFYKLTFDGLSEID